MAPFRLERVLNLRRLSADAAAREYALALQAAAAQERKIQSLRAEETRLRQVKRELIANTINVTHLRLTERYLLALAVNIAKEEIELSVRRAEAERLAQARIEAAQRVEVLEKLEERRREVTVTPDSSR